ncbi:hypothetical protein [Marinomonas rhodophyticola]|uniref:Uncharacterized protein n=1 Tax=Marinomonas rhodophyticola TaxID=2992803 RepID=A0ABT3KAJ8_9GAMM|nr:hypothetical protein [Marinomonas sp. KJ51-3]MCW4627554.1 hypothetical protein [Marinomonas sp. KJ51-3]
MSWTEDEDQQKSLEKKHETAESRTEDMQESERLDPNKEIWALLEKTLNDNLIEKTTRETLEDILSLYNVSDFHSRYRWLVCKVKLSGREFRGGCCGHDPNARSDRRR